MGVTIFTLVCVSVNIIICAVCTMWEHHRDCALGQLCCDFSITVLSTGILMSEMLACFVDTKCVPLRLLQVLPPLWCDIAAWFPQQPEFHSRRLTSGQVRYALFRADSFNISFFQKNFLLVSPPKYLNTATCGRHYQKWRRSLLKGKHWSAQVVIFLSSVSQ